MSEERLKEIKEELAKISFSNIGHCVNTNLILDYITNLQEEIERLEENNKRLKKKTKELKEAKETLEKEIKKAISFFESEEFKKSCKVLTEKLDNTGEYGYWLIVREYINCVKERLK